MSWRCMIFRKFHAWRNVRACIKCSSWIVKEDGQEQHLTCRPNSCFFSLAINACHFLWLARVSSLKKRKKKKKVLDCMKLEYCKEVLNFSNIEYRIIFLITHILGQQCHAGDSLATQVHWIRVLFRTRFCGTRVLKKWWIAKYFWNSASLPRILPKRGIWLFSPSIE